MKGYSRIYAALAVMAICTAGGTGFAQPAPAPVTREEFDKAMKELTDLRKEVADLKAQKAAASQPGAGTAASGEVAQLRGGGAAAKNTEGRPGRRGRTPGGNRKAHQGCHGQGPGRFHR